METHGKVLMIYTGGTIGMLPRDPGNPVSPLVPANWERLKQANPALGNLPIDVSLKEMKLIDSSDMNPDYWLDIAKVIGESYNDYDGFVILHGTDTMTYTASALSFLLENLSKPVILTGSQISIGQPRNDALQNLVTAIMLAASQTFGLPLVPEVCICFNNLLLRGNRARKVSSSGYGGFDTPNYERLGLAGEHIVINKKVIRKPATEGFFINNSLEKNVMMFDIFPGMSPEILKNIFNIPGLKGVVMRTFGAGNAPTNQDFLAELEHAVTKKGLTVANITQCNQGMVEMGLYAASADLLRIGLISGADMTPEATLTKLQFLLGMYGDDAATIKEQMQKDLRGEQSVNTFNLIYDRAKADPVCKLPAKQIAAGLVKDRIVSANVRFEHAALPKEVREGKIELAVFLNYPSADKNTPTNIPQCLGILAEPYSGEPVGLIMGCTDRLSQVLDPARPAVVTVVSKGETAVYWDAAYISVFTAAEL